MCRQPGWTFPMQFQEDFVTVLLHRKQEETKASLRPGVKVEI